MYYQAKIQTDMVDLYLWRGILPQHLVGLCLGRGPLRRPHAEHADDVGPRRHQLGLVRAREPNGQRIQMLNG